MNLFLGVKIPRQEIYNLFDKRIDEYLSMNITELQEKINGDKIEFSGIIHHDEEFLWIDHQPYVRLTLLDGENKLIVADSVNSTRIFLKKFHKRLFKNIIRKFRS